MKKHYIFLLLISAQMIVTTCQKPTRNMAQLNRERKRLERKIKYLEDRMLYQEANAEEPAELYDAREQLNKVQDDMKNLTCRFA
jgi:hypothetical protein